MKIEKRTPRVLTQILRSWFELTEEEQKAVIIILALFMLGLAVRYWHLRSQRSKVRGQHQPAENGLIFVPFTAEPISSETIRNPE